MGSIRKKILLLGGSAQQVAAVRTAKELGLYTVLCDYLPDNPGQYEADRYYNVSTTDVEAVYEVARANKVDGILPYASDPAALPAAIVAERLGLPANPSETVAILGIKDKFRDFLSKEGFACPRYRRFGSSCPHETIAAAVSDFRFPLIVKPTDSSGSKGVTKLAGLRGLDDSLAKAFSYSRSGNVIIEEFIERGFPHIIGGDIFVWDGKIVLYGEMSCLRGDGGRGLVPVGEKWPSGLNAMQTRKVHDALRRIIGALGYRAGELNMEIILDRDDNVHFLELGPRAGGNMIPIQLGDIFGTDLVKANVLAAVGEKPEIEAEKRPGCFMHYVLHACKDGIFDGIDTDAEIERHIYRKVLYRKPGDRAERFDGAGKALGILFIRTDTAEQMNSLCERMHTLVKIKVK